MLQITHLFKQFEMNNIFNWMQSFCLFVCVFFLCSGQFTIYNEYLEKTTHLPQVTGKLYHIMNVIYYLYCMLSFNLNCLHKCIVYSIRIQVCNYCKYKRNKYCICNVLLTYTGIYSLAFIQTWKGIWQVDR
jgi:hypothetical protein